MIPDVSVPLMYVPGVSGAPLILTTPPPFVTKFRLTTASHPLAVTDGSLPEGAETKRRRLQAMLCPETEPSQPPPRITAEQRAIRSRRRIGGLIAGP